MRVPPELLVVDSAILIQAIWGRSKSVLLTIAGLRTLATTSAAIRESRRRVALGMKRSDLLPLLDEVTGLIAIRDEDDYGDYLPLAERSLLNAVGSRNGSTKDAHILALAWARNADIWSPDRDFAGTGVASWSTPNLVRALTAPL